MPELKFEAVKVTVKGERSAFFNESLRRMRKVNPVPMIVNGIEHRAHRLLCNGASYTPESDEFTMTLIYKLDGTSWNIIEGRLAVDAAGQLLYPEW